MSPPQIPDAGFLQDDLHFRTLTSLLSLFSRPDKRQYDSKVALGMRSDFKRMMGLSTILSRDPEEVVACMAKRSIDNITLFCITEKKKTAKQDCARHGVIVIKNPPPPTLSPTGDTIQIDLPQSPEFVDTVGYPRRIWYAILFLIPVYSASLWVGLRSSHSASTPS